MLQPHFSHSDHLVIKVQITIWAPTLLKSTDLIKISIDVYIKALLGASLYFYVLQISGV
jgi:hypothetical protein